MKLIKFFVAPFVLLGALAQSATAQLIDLQISGPKSNRVNILFLGDGYTASEKDKFLADAASFKTALLDAPWDKYTRYFNSYALFTESVQSGASYEDAVTVKNTAYKCRYWTANIQRLLVCDSALTNATKNQYLPEADIVMVIVNSNMYGGSGGSISVANRTSPEIVAHEVGHTFVRLADEYDYPGSSSREAPNATQNITRSTLTWRHWVEASTPLATPETNQYATVVGAFEGAAYQPIGWYRPTLTSRMQVNGAPLGPVNSEQFLLAMYNAISPIDLVQPAAGNVILQPGGGLTVTPLKPDNTNLAIEWWVNGVKTTQTGTTFPASSLPNGSSNVTVRVIDQTPLVRKDPDGLLYDSASWVVQKNGGSSSSSSSSSVVSSSSKPSSVSSSSSSGSGTWTAWLNRDTASGSGDFETRADFGSTVCAVPTAIEARVRGTTTVYVPGNATPDVLQSFSPSVGLACQNAVQNDGICSDYEVRFLCLASTSSSSVSSSPSSSSKPSSSSSSSSSIAFTRTVQAESYNVMNGVQLETTQDPSGGGQNVGWIDATDWMVYSNVNFPSSGTYRVEYRVASLGGGGVLDLNLNAGTIPLGQLAVPSTGGWQLWTTISHNVSITAGTYNLGLYAVQGGWNVNWIRITKL